MYYSPPAGRGKWVKVMRMMTRRITLAQWSLSRLWYPPLLIGSSLFGETTYFFKLLPVGEDADSASRVDPSFVFGIQFSHLQ
jgi:hypothetical protein